MKNISFRSLSIIRTLMIFLNYFIVLFYSSVILLSTKYIINNNVARDFLNQISHIPRNPVYILLLSMLFYGVLVFIIYYKQNSYDKKNKYNYMYSVLEIILGVCIIYTLYVGYSGIVLLIFCDSIFFLKDHKYSKWILGVLIVIYFIAHYDIISIFMNIPNPIQYFNVYDGHIKGILTVSKNILETINIILFIAFMIMYIANQIQENENITKELDMIHQVNKELQDYAAVTEKIGEDKERKRLAREIHDTLGHALTGIAAGIDACLAMIDTHPKETKQQLEVVSKVVRQGIGDVRNSLNKLRPGVLEEQGFRVAIEKMIEEFSSVSDLSIDFHYQLEKIDFENTKEDILFRIIQESITNALRHGGATHIDIYLYKENQFVLLKIKDNGKGCEKIQYGFGLKQMQERVSIINGEVEYDGTDGFLTIVKIPIQRGEDYD
jgi:Signal transduction histidine kinase